MYGTIFVQSYTHYTWSEVAPDNIPVELQTQDIVCDLSVLMGSTDTINMTWFDMPALHNYIA